MEGVDRKLVSIVEIGSRKRVAQWEIIAVCMNVCEYIWASRRGSSSMRLSWYSRASSRTFWRICAAVGTMVVVDIRPPVRGARATKPKAPSLALSSGEEEGEDGVTWRGWLVRRRWKRIRRFISTFSTSEEDEGEGVESREETKMDEEGRDMLWTRWTDKSSREVFTFGC